MCCLMNLVEYISDCLASAWSSAASLHLASDSSILPRPRSRKNCLTHITGINIKLLLDDSLYTRLDIDFNGCEDATGLNKDSNNNAEQTAVVKSVIKDQVSLLRAAVHCQRDTILKLQHQLRSVLSIIGITEQNIQLTGVDESKPTNNIVTCQADMVDHAAVQPQ